MPDRHLPPVAVDSEADAGPVWKHVWPYTAKAAPEKPEPETVWRQVWPYRTCEAEVEVVETAQATPQVAVEAEVDMAWRHVWPYVKN